MGLPRLMIASLRGGSGKTLLTMGILASWKAQGIEVVPFKKGPDYIDAGWMAKAAGHPCFNLDPFLMGKGEVLRSFRRQAGSLSVIEGNRGLFDGIDPQGTFSSAELAKTLKSPVILIVDCTKVTRTAAAMVLGCRELDSQLDLKGVILNNLAGARHERVTRKAVEAYGRLPVLGAVPRLPASHLPERHLGLTPVAEHPETAKVIQRAKRLAEDYLDLESLKEIAIKADPLRPLLIRKRKEDVTVQGTEGPLIGVIEDRAFQFYYPENLSALERAGARLRVLNALDGVFPKELDGLYIGGGFPETQALGLSRNLPFQRALKRAVEEGLPVYAECGGLMYLGKGLEYKGKYHSMVGIFPVDFVLEKKPQGHGYTRLKVIAENPYFPLGKEIRGHEFHYSRIKNWSARSSEPVFALTKGTGLDGQRDGLVYKNVLASYTHIHALGTPDWAPAVVRVALGYRHRRTGSLGKWEGEKVRSQG